MDGTRPIALAPYFPLPEAVDGGESASLRLVLIGERAIAARESVFAAMAGAGASRGLGRDRVLFDVELESRGDSDVARAESLSEGDLPQGPATQPGVVPWLSIRLLSPLFIKEEAGPRSGASPVMKPRFEHVLRASLRVVSLAASLHGDGARFEETDFSGLKEASRSIETTVAAWEPFRQVRTSSKQGRSHTMVGVVGAAAYRNVPVAFLPWLVWGGRLGCGEFRTHGAGAWSIFLA